MKKLLGILGTITISGSGMAGLVGNAPVPSKTEINSLETNILENLNRNKRDNQLSSFASPGLLKIIFSSNLGASDAAVFQGFRDDSTSNYKNLIFISANKRYKYNTINTKIDLIDVNSRPYISSDDDFKNNIQFLFKKQYYASEGKIYEYNLNNGDKNIIIDSNDKNTKFEIAVPPTPLDDNCNCKKIYIFSSKGILYEYEPFVLVESDINDMKELVKRGLYLQYKKQEPNSNIKQILDINLENLVLSNVIINEKQENKSFSLEKDLDSACKDSSSTFINRSNIEQTQYTPSCSKQFTETNTFQKMNGFSKSNSKSETDNWSWNVNSKVTAKSSVSAGIPLLAEGKIEVAVEVGSGYTWGGSKNYTITDSSNSADTKIKTNTDTSTITVTAQPVKVPPHSKISIYNKTWNNNIELILNVFQKVSGNVSAYFIDENNNKTTVFISIKDAMLNLLENKILPSKIKINNDDSINFSYDIKSIKEIIMHETEIGKAIPL